MVRLVDLHRLQGLEPRLPFIIPEQLGQQQQLQLQPQRQQAAQTMPEVLELGSRWLGAIMELLPEVEMEEQVGRVQRLLE